MQIEDNYSLLQHNTFGMNVKARRFVQYESEAELLHILSTIPADEPLLHIGGGSNLLFTADYDGTVLHSAIKGIEVVDETEDTIMVRVGAGEVWDDFVRHAVERGWGGIENLSLIPGEVGASAVQNIGAYGVEAKDCIAVVEAVELRSRQKRVFGNAECAYGYRQSIFKGALKGCYAVTYVTFRLSLRPVLSLDYGGIRRALENCGVSSPTIADVRQAIIDIRNAKLPDPKVQGNAGSFFMNPVVTTEKFEEIRAQYPDVPAYEVDGGVKIPAGWMIEKCGWKGRALGRAAVHSRQALVLVNLGGATSEEIMALSDAVCRSVSETFGVDIHPEVNFI